MSDYISEEKDLKALSFAVENYAEQSTYRTDRIIDNFCSKISKFSARNDFGSYFDELIYAIVEDINSTGEIERFLEYMSENDRSPIYNELKEKYFSSEPVGTYTIAIPGIDDSSLSEKTEQVLDPRMSDDAYLKILNTIHHIGTNIEQDPNSFVDLGETSLRSHIMSALKASFPVHSPTAETFNATGKTDIIIKHLNSNLFVAECKIWNGKSNIEPAIDQLMDYLTWRDSKTALILFVKTTNFSSILKQIKEIVKQHPNHLKFVNSENENRFNFEFSLKSDPSKIIKLAVICFDFSNKKRKSKS